MKKKFGKFLSILLTAVMLVGMLPATAFADDRTVVSKVVAESDSDMTPKYGKQTAYHTFTVTEGQPAWLTGNDWWKLIDGVWKQMEDGDTFGEGTYRYRAQLRIDDKKFDGKDKTTHVLAKEGLTLEVDEKGWDMLGSVTVGDGDASVSYVRVCSQPFNVEAPEGQGLKFYDSGTFDIGRNYVGRAITSYSVAGYVEGGTQPYTFSKVSGPAWIAVSAVGEISGKPTAAGENTDLVVQVTDSNSAAKKITIEVADTKINPDDRTEISAVTATSDIKPEYGEQATNPTFTVTEGKPAWLTGNDWWKMVDGEWTEM
ncbi:MAG: hypothetical protein IJE57_06090, partial [Anaerotignum sp.]|nr:hypothetical protein [Anaerotignum sp.]